MTIKLPTTNPQNSGGFTITDVAIASAIFAGVLIVCLTAFIAMGRIYFRGSIESKVQESARGITNEIRRTIATTAAEYKDNIPKDPVSGWEAYCIAGVKYSFRKHRQLEREPPTGADKQVKRVFIKSIVETGGTATGNCDGVNDPAPPEGKGIELLDYRMRIHDFSIEKRGRLFVIKLDLIYGGNPDDIELEKAVFEFINPARKTEPSSTYEATLVSAIPDEAYKDQTSCELTETFCYINRVRVEIYQTIAK